MVSDINLLVTEEVQAFWEGARMDKEETRSVVMLVGRGGVVSTWVTKSNDQLPTSMKIFQNVNN